MHNSIYCLTLILAFVTVIFGFRSSQSKLFGQTVSSKKCNGLKEACLSTTQCCPELICDYNSQNGEESSSECVVDQDTKLEGKPCEKDRDCGSEMCCKTEYVGFRGVEIQVCKKLIDSCNDDGGSLVDSNDAYLYDLIRKRAIKRTVN